MSGVTWSTRAPSGVVAVFMVSCSCAVPHTAQPLEGGQVAMGCTSRFTLTCCCRNVF